MQPTHDIVRVYVYMHNKVCCSHTLIYYYRLVAKLTDRSNLKYKIPRVSNRVSDTTYTHEKYPLNRALSHSIRAGNIMG